MSPFISLFAFCSQNAFCLLQPKCKARHQVGAGGDGVDKLVAVGQIAHNVAPFLLGTDAVQTVNGVLHNRQRIGGGFGGSGAAIQFPALDAGVGLLENGFVFLCRVFQSEQQAVALNKEVLTRLADLVIQLRTGEVLVVPCLAGKGIAKLLFFLRDIGQGVIGFYKAFCLLHPFFHLFFRFFGIAEVFIPEHTAFSFCYSLYSSSTGSS